MFPLGLDFACPNAWRSLLCYKIDRNRYDSLVAKVLLKDTQEVVPGHFSGMLWFHCSEDNFTLLSVN
jgi:hypothetical protein